ncbi:MAG: acyl-CoA dehydratase activase-related protein [Elusimicrobiota bacterium]
MSKKIGIPSALVNNYYRSYWRTFFTEIGMEVVESGKTTKAIVNKGVRYAVPEICVPIKIYMGHVIELMGRGVDYIYVPRLVALRDRETFCPKFLGLPDMLKFTIPELEQKLLTHDIETQDEDIGTSKNYLELGRRLCVEDKVIKTAVKAASAKWYEFRKECLKGYDCNQANSIVLNNKKIEINKVYPVKLGVIGYVYNVYDNYISMDVLDRLESLGVGYETFEMLGYKKRDKQMKRFRKPLFWTFSNKLLSAGYHFFEDPGIAGVIHVTAFACGPDSFLGKMLELDSEKYKKPFMTIRVDEHTGENHLQTRVEAFVDMILRKKNENNIPVHG